MGWMSPAEWSRALASKTQSWCARSWPRCERPMTRRYGHFGGQYVPETLMSACLELEQAWAEAKDDPEFQLELAAQRHAFVGRPTPLYAADRLTEHFAGATIHLKREDLCHTGAHKLNHALGQGPHPYPELVRDLQRVIGDEARDQYLVAEGRLPDVVVACVGGGSNAIGMFTAFLDDTDVQLIGVEAAGRGLRSGAHAASLVGGR